MGAPQNKTILYVEDHPDSREVVRRLLADAGYTVLTAGSAEEALRQAQATRVDLLIADVGLPDGSGLELLGQIRDLYPAKGIVLSGYGMDADLKKALLAGFDEHLLKPVTIENLMNVVERVLCSTSTPEQTRRQQARRWTELKGGD